jgi:hypothetical protein
MRRFLTVGITAEDKVHILHGAENEKSSHREKFREVVDEGRKAKKGKAQFAEVILIDLSHGVIKRKKFTSVPVEVRRAKVKSKRAAQPDRRRIEIPKDVKTLEDHTIDELRDLDAKEKADLTGLSVKAAIVAAIELNRTPLIDRTIDQLKELAEREQIDLTGKTVKADIVAAIEEARKPKQDEGIFPKAGADAGPSL